MTKGIFSTSVLFVINSDMKKVSIYLLIDPRTDEIRYVGKTEQKLSSRISAHIADKTLCHRTNWLAELKCAGLRPVGVTIETIEGEWPWQQEERYWISKLKAMGARLVNNTSGGDGVPDLPKETRERMRRVWIGRKHSPETIEKLKAARAKRITTAETRAKMSRTRRGRKITWGVKIAAATRKLTHEQVDQIKHRLADGERVCAIAAEFKMHRTSISKIKTGSYFVK